MIKKTIKFNLNDFIGRLDHALTDYNEIYDEDDNVDRVDDILKDYKQFLSRVDKPLLSSVKSYVNRHMLVADNEVIKSFIDTCYN